MKRRLFNFAAALSLVLGIGIAALWLVGQERENIFALGTLQRGVGLINSESCVALWAGDIALPTNRRTVNDSDAPGLLYRTMSGPPRTYMLFIRHWLLLLITLPPPLAWFLTARLRERMLRRSEGLCCHCGYNLRATPERCPECGAVPSPPPTVVGATR